MLKKVVFIFLILGIFVSAEIMYFAPDYWDFSLDASNITSGIINNDRYNMSYLNFTNTIINNFSIENNFTVIYNITNNFTVENNFTVYYNVSNNLTWFLNDSYYEYAEFNNDNINIVEIYSRIGNSSFLNYDYFPVE